MVFVEAVLRMLPLKRGEGGSEKSRPIRSCFVVQKKTNLCKECAVGYPEIEDGILEEEFPINLGEVIPIGMGVTVRSPKPPLSVQPGESLIVKLPQDDKGHQVSHIWIPGHPENKYHWTGSFNLLLPRWIWQVQEMLIVSWVKDCECCGETAVIYRPPTRRY